jgi:SHS2 domain-containing protein
MYEIFDHTADLGLRIRATSLAGLCEDAARGLTEIIAGDAASIRPAHAEIFEIRASEPAMLLFDWLNELLYAFESRRMLFSRFEVSTTDGGLRAVAQGERYDPARHSLAHEVKAITYHGLEARRARTASDEHWEGSVIVDI